MPTHIDAALAKNISQKYEQRLHELVPGQARKIMDSLKNNVLSIELGAYANQSIFHQTNRSIYRTAAKALFWHTLSLKLKENPRNAYDLTISHIKSTYGEFFAKEIFAGGSFFGTKRTYSLIENHHLAPEKSLMRAWGCFGFRWGLFGWWKANLIDEKAERAQYMRSATITKIQIDSNTFYEFQFNDLSTANKCARGLFLDALVNERPPRVHSEDGKIWLNVHESKIMGVADAYKINLEELLQSPPSKIITAVQPPPYDKVQQDGQDEMYRSLARIQGI